MKHFTQTTANGLHTPPCGSSQSKSTRFSLLTSFLLFFLMFVGSNAVWASTNYFTPGKTIHVHKNCSGSGFCAWGNDMGVIFFYQDEPTKAYGCDCTSEYSKLGTGQQYNSSAAFFCTKDDDYNWHFTVPTPPAGKHIGYFRILKLEGSYWCHQQMKICSADDFSGSNNCVTYSQWDYNTGDQSKEGLTSEWSGGGENILNDGAGGGGGDPEPDPEPISEVTPVIHGDGLPGLNPKNSGNWDSNTIEMLEYGEDHTFYAEFLNVPATSDNSYRFKIDVNEEGDWWSGAMCNSNVSQANSNVEMVTDDDRISFKMPFEGDVYVFYKSDNDNDKKVWIVAVPKEIGAGSGSNARMHTDLIMDGTSWIDNGINLVRNNNAAVTYQYVTSYIAPACTSDEMNGTGGKKAPKVRFDIKTSSVQVDKPSDLNLALTTQIRRVIYLWNSGSGASSVKRYVIPSYPNHSSDDGWKVWCHDGNNDISGNLVNGSVTVQIGGNKDVKYFITNSSSCTGPSGSAFKSNTVHTVNSFGGCYVDKSASINNVTFKSDHQVYTRNDAGVYKLGDLAKPIVADNDCRGIFRLADGHGDKTYDVTFTFDGGVITINAVEHVTPAATYTVTLHPNNGGDNIVRTSVPEGSTTSAAALNLAAVTYGVGTATWYTNSECTTPFSSVTSNMDLYAKWGVSGNYYVVGDLWMYDAGGNWDNNKGQLMTNTNRVSSVTYTAPKGLNRFEIIKDRDWGQKINGGNYSSVINASSPIPLSVSDGHIVFTLTEAKQVTITFDGKVSVSATDYSFNQMVDWRVKTSDSGWGNVPGSWDHSNVMTKTASGASIIIRNVPGSTNHSFMITRGSNEQDLVGTYNFNALWLDTSSPSSGLTWNMQNTNIGDRQLAQTDNLWRNCSFRLSEQSDVRITFDGGKIRCDILPKYTVTFNSNDGSEVASQSVFEGAQASEPSAPTKAGYEFVKWQLSGVDYTFSEAVTGNITLDAVWAYKAISSVELNESEHTTWVGNSDFVLTLTKNPSDLITKSVVWSSDAEGIASVSDGTVHAEGVGTATITCTVTDMFDTQRSTTCEVTVAACQMTTDDLYSMTVTGYNSSTGSSATLNGLWNESSDNTEPATFRIVKLKLSNSYYIYDDNGTVKMSTDASLATAQWYEIPTGETYSPNWTGSSFALYEFKNVSTGKYLRRGNGRYGNNGDWYYYTTLADSRETDGNQYKFFYDNTMGTHLVCREGADYNEGQTVNELKKAFAIHNNNLNWAAGYSDHCAAPMVICGYTNDPNGNTYTKLHETVVVDPSYANPNYKASQMNSSYYRMKADATVQANLANGLAYGSVITVRLYADAATSVKLQTAAGDDVETINLSADAAREYTYTVAYGSELVGATAFIIKAADNHAGIASIEVSRMHAVSPADPALTWDADLSSGVTQSALAGTFQHVASSALSEGTIHYTSSNEAVATVAADGTVTPIMAGNTTITATIEQRECYAEASIPYEVTLTEPTLAEMIAADAGEGITLTHDYAENIVIDKAITINGAGHSVGNLTVETAGDLTLSGALTVNDFSIYAKAGNTTLPAASGQVRNAANLTANGNAYFYYTVDPSGTVHYGWYDFTVPFRVNVMTGIAGIENEVLNEDFVNERNYAIMEHLGDKQAAGQYAYKKFRGIMEPCRLYSITLDDDYNYNTIRFKKADGALAAGNEVTLNAYAGEAKHANWNGVGNGTLHHADVEVSTVGYIQVYQSGEKTFLPVDRGQYSLVVGSAFMIQQAGTMTLNQASHDKLLAPRRAANAQPTAIQIASEGKPFSDQLFISADEMAGQSYTQGVDVAKAGNIGNVNVPQIWTNAYNTSLCAHEAQLIDGEAQYTLSLYAPANGTYTLTSKNIPEGYTLYLTQNGNKLWDMSDTYVLDLTKGTTTEYGLLLVENYKMPTAVDNIFSNTDETTKIMRNGILYILQNGKVFNAQGARVK